MRKQEALVVRNYRIFLIILYVFTNKKNVIMCRHSTIFKALMESVSLP